MSMHTRPTSRARRDVRALTTYSDLREGDAFAGVATEHLVINDEPVDPSHITAATITASSVTSGTVTALAAEDAPPSGLNDQDAAPATNDDATPAQTAYWEGTIGVEGVATGDGRIISPDALTWGHEDDGTLSPVSLRYVRQDVGAHDGAVVVGRFDRIERRDDGVIWAAGRFDLGSEDGREAYRQVSEGYMTGVSMDLDDVSFEVRVAAEVIEEMESLVEALDDEGDLPAREVNDDGTVTVATLSPSDELMVTTSARIRSATLVAIPAFAQAHLAAVDAPSYASEDRQEDAPAVSASGGIVTDEAPAGASDPDALIAAAIPVEPPADWFRDPGLTGPTALAVTDDGRVYGHLATWDVCHIGDPAGSGVCVQAPRSASGYSHFHTGATKTTGGTIATGRLTMGTGHAPLAMRSAAALAHYDNTGTAVADVVAGEDAYGIWVAGALRPGVTPGQVRTLRGSPLSGDWRRIGTAHELVGALAVNVPGFPIPRPAGMVASGELVALTASGLVPPKRVKRPGTPGALSEDDLAYLRRLVQRERAAEGAALRDRAAAAINRQKVAAFAARRKEN